ncbi:hypothetical protein LCGC14_0384600 [marine sediment metagenome]|uniref:Anticodon-binding domain-containing protein n=1 Tax=marine sediment metagenome TaxID=412755 RepID=A0A0F9VNN0_9ZZZZ
MIIVTLADKGITVELYPRLDVKLDKQLKYANKRGFPYVLIIGEKEAKQNKVRLKDMNAKVKTEGKLLSLDKVISLLRS